MANHFNFLSIILILAIIFIISLSNLDVIESSNGSLTIDLIHRDSPFSPLYNPSETSWQHWQKSFLRGINHVAADVLPDKGQYLVKFSIGTPPVEVHGILDAGSDLIWTQCAPCPGCYKQILPLFDPTKSSTYKDLPCQNKMCEELSPNPCSRSKNCQYGYGYGGAQYTKGNLATDTFTFGSLSLPNKVFGCGHNNSGTFDERGTGIVGLGLGSMSMITQLTSTYGFKFSYCLVPLSAPTVTSKLTIGNEAVVSGSGTVSTPLVVKPKDTFYYVTLQAMSVGNTRLPYDHALSPNGSKEGNLIIDTGVPPILIPTQFYNQMVVAVKGAISGQPLTNKGTQLCYSSNTKIDVTITAHFTGADVQLKPENTFVSTPDGSVCFAMNPDNNIAIFGNFAQMNFLIGYDLANKMLFFKPTDCTKPQ
ncbi:aspartic proteinase CDR1-like [Telopea speciosissima]|uniref:aspartic proteinase CDR1-like n=1 Tax=Telopea speciosissima TaxID=54955 RepID=UPI001CC400B8|nr:aspartic proteinase CDR1-like [Telopea speciosissima]